MKNVVLPLCFILFLTCRFFAQDADPAQSSSQLAPCDYNTIQCGQTLTNQTNAGYGNDFVLANYSCYSANQDPFDAPDHQYRIQITSKTSVRFILDITTPNIDLGMFLLSSCSPAVCIAYSDEFNVNNNLYREVLDVNLSPGLYYLVIDGFNANQIGNYNLSVNCTCSCIEGTGDQPLGEKLYCDNFQDYIPKDSLDPQSTRWRRWFINSADAAVDTTGGNAFAHFKQVGTTTPDMLYLLGDKTSGRYRVSWRMFVPAGKKAYYNMLHQLPLFSNATGANWAFEVFFNGDGTGQFRLNNSGNITTKDFNYPSDRWFNVANIIELNYGTINNVGSTVFINNNYVHTWNFSQGSNSNQNKLAAVDFFADTGSEFYVDDICVWGKTGNCSPIPSEESLCIKNGGLYHDEPAARCDLYTSREWWQCNPVCEYGGSFIYRGDNVTGQFESTDLNFNLPLNSGFDNCDPGPAIVGDVYIFYKNDNDDVIIANFTSTSNLSQHYTFTCKLNNCTFGKECITGFENDPSLTPCNNFYYIVVIGPVGATYSFNLVPNGPCPTNPETLNLTNCNATDNDVTSTNNLTVANGAYTQCYTGSRTYAGGEKIYKFTLSKPSQVTITLSSATPDLGLFLFSFLCGKNCIDYAEKATAGANAVINTVLNDGTYYIAVDKATAGTANFSIQVQCDPFANFYNYTGGNVNSCPLNPNVQHTVRIQGTSYNFSVKDQIQFVFWDNNNTLKGTDSLVRNWNGGPFMDFVIKGDDPGDNVKCSYLPGDTFVIYLVQRENGKRILRKLLPTYRTPNNTPGLNATKTFAANGGSIIDDFKEDSVVTFGAQTLSFTPPSTTSANLLTFSTNLQWAVEKIPSTAGWLNLNKLTSDGAEDITMTTQFNPNELPRSAVLRFYATAYPNVYQDFVTIQQQGICNPSPNLTIAADKTTLCAGKSVSQPITVNPRPAPPGNPGNQSVCEGTAVPPLSVSVSAGQTADWFAQATGGDSIAAGTIQFTPNASAPGTYVFYAQSRTVATGCISATRTPVTLTILPKPTLTVNEVFCAANLQTYQVTISSNASAMTATAGTVSGGNGVFTISNIPKNANVTITATGANGCSRQSVVTAPDCPCPAVAAPVSGGNKTICAGEPIPALTVTVDPGQTADWYSAGGAQLAQGTLSYTPAGAGSYFAETRDTLTGCVSASRTAVALTINPLPTIVVNAKPCTLPLSTNLYSVDVTLSPGSTLSASVGQVAGSSVTAIPAGQPVTLTATNPSTNCSFQLVVSPPDCMCPNVNPPQSGGNQAICAGTTIPTLSVSVGAGETANWYSPGGMLLAGGTTGFTPPASGTYLTETENSTTGCRSAVKTPVSLVIHPLPVITTGSPECAPNLLSYQITVSTSGTQLTADKGAVSGSAGAYAVSGVPTGAALLLTALIDSTGCSAGQLVNSPSCPCPVVNAPVSGGDQVICSGQPLPALTAIVGPNETANWYSGAGVLLASDTTSFIPPGAGTYLAEAKNLINDCVSSTRTPVKLTVNPVPILTLAEKQCAPDLLSYSITVTGAAGLSVTASEGTVSANGGTYTVGNISPGADVVITAIQPATGCTFQLTEAGISCDCPVVLPPVSGGDKSYCKGATIPVLQVTVGMGETAVWYNAFGNVVASNVLSYTPVEPGVYYAETRQLVNDCRSSTRTPVVLTEHPLPALVLIDTVCALNRQSYSATVSTDGSIPQTTPIFPVIPNGGGTYTIANIPVGVSVNISSKFNATGCQSTLSVLKDDCPCPVVNPPLSGGDKTICAGDPLSSLTVSVGPGETVDWYLQPSLGIPLPNGIGTTSFVPPAAGTYFAQTRNDAIGCISQSRTPVSLLQQDRPLVFAGMDQSICAGQSITLDGTISGANGGQWLASVSGGFFEPNNGYLSAVAYTPPAGSSNVVLTLQSTDPPGPCPAVADQLVLTIEPLPKVEVDTLFCAPDLNSYTVRFTSEGQVSVTAGNLIQVGPQSYELRDIPQGLGVTIRATFLDTDCELPFIVPAPACNCPFIEQPVSKGDQFVCPGQAFPSLSVTVGAGQSANWYDTAGAQVASQTILFTPQVPGLYFAETVDLVNKCASAVRTPVRLTVYQGPVADAGPDVSTCPGIPVSLTGQTANVTYQWSTGEMTSSIVVNPAQNTEYYLVVTSTEGCKDTDSVLVVILPAPDATITVLAPVKCNGDANGALSVNASGGSPPYTVAWSNGVTAPQNPGIPAGAYAAVITDKFGCRDTADYILTQPEPLVIADFSIQNTAAGQFNGAITIQVSGGIQGYHYQWAEGSFIFSGRDTFALTAIGTGTYFVTVTDQNGCAVFGGPYPVQTIATNGPDWYSHVSVFPNPSPGQFYLRFTLPEPMDVKINVYDAIGKELQSALRTGVREDLIPVDLSIYPSGLYLLNLSSEHGHLSWKITLDKN